MIELIIRQTPHDVRETAWGFGALESTYSGKQLPAALDSILDGMTAIRASAELAEALSTHDDFCELAAQVAVIRKLQRELDDRDATDADHAVLNEIRRSSNPWLHREAGNLLALIADERDQVAAHDGIDAIAENVAGTRVRYTGEVESIKGKCGVLTGVKRIPEELGVPCIEVEIGGATWAIPCEYRQFELAQ